MESGSEIDTEDQGQDGTDTTADTASECEDVEVPGNCVRFVNAGVANAGDGLSWCTAFRQIADGIESAYSASQEEGECQVWVAQGTYYVYEGSSLDTILLRPKVEVYGGFHGEETELSERDWEWNETVISGYNGGTKEFQVFHVVTGSDDALIDGFTIADGKAVPNDDGVESSGAGMINVDCSPTVANCKFRNNLASEYGGGIFNQYSSTYIVGCSFEENSVQCGIGGGGVGNIDSEVEMVRCTFHENSSNFDGGGGIFSRYSDTTVTECEFHANSVPDPGLGGAISNSNGSLHVEDSWFTENSAGTGGAIYCGADGTSFIRNSEISGNVANAHGGGGIGSNGGNVEMRKTMFHGNTAMSGFGGGGLYANGDHFYLENCIFWGNHSAGPRGGGAILIREGQIQVENSTCYANSTSAANGGGIAADEGTELTIINTILWGNGTEELDALGALTEVGYSLVQDGHEGIGNIDGEPMYIDEDAGDFRLLSGSPCIDAADGVSAPDLDFYGSARTDDPATTNTGMGPPWADIGAVEYLP